MKKGSMKTLMVAALGMTALAADTQSPDALAAAIKLGHRPVAIDMIAKKSADVNAAEADGSTPLLWAANLNDTDLALRLLKAGADPKARNQLGSTPLGEAALNSNTQMIQALLDAGADPNAAGPDGQTPMMILARTANVEAAKLLLSKGANPNMKDFRRFMPRVSTRRFCSMNSLLAWRRSGRV